MRRTLQALAVFLAVVLGLSLYGYLFLSSSTNPPMNWGHCSQWEGFKHHFTRGQYEKVRLDRLFFQFWGLVSFARVAAFSTLAGTVELVGVSLDCEGAVKGTVRLQATRSGRRKLRIG